MTLLALAVFTLLSLAAGQSNVNEQTAGGVGSRFEPRQQGPIGGPFVTTTTVTSVLDFGPASSRISRSRGTEWNHRFGDRKSYKNFGERDIDVILNTWDILKKRGNFAPKLFLRYFKAKPESQKLFPSFANVPLSELPANRDFLNSAYSCINSLNFLIPYLKYDHPERCPNFPRHLKNKYNNVDLKKFGSIWMTAVQEEMGNAFTDEVRDVWKKSVMAVIDFASK
ncbi:uncharacterized protein LOC123476783 [Daphnia magna]|uniref:Globin domain-containing protein n=1 Tax=Daphnia magna TaxID=35525 RepID=A0ABQ9ZPT2_9CRUS|nr:uncharacterized protein LOC123476783 [Daphnia magna]KAK4014940.1 hypothetical protein OUZ56_027452 [Daphnia magna]